MLRDRKALMEQEFANLKAEAARLYLEAVTSDRTAISPEYEAMKGRICVTLRGVKKRVYPDDPILNDPDIVFGWK